VTYKCSQAFGNQDKIPWASTYKKPQTDLVSAEDLKKYTQAPTLTEENEGVGEEKGELEEKAQSPKRSIVKKIAAPPDSTLAKTIAAIELNLLEAEEDEWIATPAPQVHCLLVCSSRLNVGKLCRHSMTF
jgi:hypothetical protein